MSKLGKRLIRSAQEATIIAPYVAEIERLKAENAATIERCAQVGIEFLRGLAMTWRNVDTRGKIRPSDAADCLEQAIDGFAAAIRAVKDKQ